MTTGTTRRGENITRASVLHLAFELGDGSWKLGFTTGLGQAARRRSIRARDTAAILREVERARRRFGLGGDVRVVSCYEAGREGFWLHRWLESRGIANRVVDSSSIQVDRRARRVKTDRVDLEKLVRMLVRAESGEKKVWSVVRVPTVAQEDARHLHRSLKTLKSDRNAATNRISGLLATQGVTCRVGRDFPAVLESLRVWDGSPVPPGLQARLLRNWSHREWLTARIREVEAERRALLRDSSEPAVEQVRRLMRLRGIGENSAWVFVMEFFAWREFENRREVGSLAGLTCAHYGSSSIERDQGISKAGNAHVREMIVQIAWGWLRYQPESARSQWYEERFGWGSRRMRKVGIVALARQLLVDLWRYVDRGIVPEGAVLEA